MRCGMSGISLAGKWGKGAMWYDWDFPRNGQSRPQNGSRAAIFAAISSFRSRSIRLLTRFGILTRQNRRTGVRRNVGCLWGNGGRVRCGMSGGFLAGKWGKGAMWYDWDFPCGEMGEGCDVV